VSETLKKPRAQKILEEPKATTLLDVNVLLALFDPLHIHHSAVRNWYATGSAPVATCALTELGFVRICSHPRYPNPVDHPEQALALLRALHSDARHEFWFDTLSLADPVFQAHPFKSHRETTDRYLLRLAVDRGAKLLTLDTAMRPSDADERAALWVLSVEIPTI
jgi:uncharacterized protein